VSDDPYSASWYRVAELRPRLRGHVRIHRHNYRGERWYVLEDRVSRRMHRFNAVAYYAIGLMDGRRRLQEIWESALGKFGDDAPTQDEMIRLLGQLHGADVLQADVAPDVAEILRRSRRSAKSLWRQNLLSPLALRFPLFDPERLLERWLPFYRPLFGWAGAIIWCLVVGSAALAAAQHWSELSGDFADRVLAPQNLLLMYLTFPLLKLCHEFGHACATRAWGGEVHEMGVMFLVLMPIPYVDASAASAFAQARRRAVVGAAGMMVELFLASIALFLWLEAQPGVARAVLYNVMLIAGISTVFFNANPLLRHDGYYILCDVLQMPNLRNRANEYLGYLVNAKLFGLGTPAPEATTAEKYWLVLFAVASFVYRTFVMVAIAVFIASRYMVVGVLLALWAVVTSFLLPIAKGLGYVLLHSRVRAKRARAVAVTAGIAAGMALFLFVLPLPLWVNAEGVIGVPEEARVRAGADGFVRQVLFEPGRIVSRGTPLVAAEDFELASRILVLEARLRLLEVRAHAELQEDRVRWLVTREEIAATRAELAYARERHSALTVRSAVSGEFVLAAASDLPARYVRKGQDLGYVVPAGMTTARVLVSQDEIDLVRQRTERVRIKLAGRLYDTYEAKIRREVPAASDRVVNLAMSSAGGGAAALDPQASQQQQARTLGTWFEYELELPTTRAFVLGEHVYARFELGSEPLAWRGYRAIRQLFLRRFAV
jgi:putative peptide zinc metalloprotease protein